MQAEVGMLRPGGTSRSETHSCIWGKWSGSPMRSMKRFPEDFFVTIGIPYMASHFILFSMSFSFNVTMLQGEKSKQIKCASVSHSFAISCNLHFAIVTMEYWNKFPSSVRLLHKFPNVAHGVIVLCTKEKIIYWKYEESCFSRSDLWGMINKCNCGRRAVRLHDCKSYGWVGRTAANGLLNASIFCWAGNILLPGRNLPLCYMELYFAQR